MEITEIHNLSKKLDAVSDIRRISIVDILSENGPMSVAEIQIYLCEREGLETEATLLSHHLRLLRESNILACKRKGRQKVYSLVTISLEGIIDNLKEIISIYSDSKMEEVNG